MIPLPNEFQTMIQTMLGDEAPAFFAALEQPSTLALRINPLRTEALSAAASFSEAAVPWEPLGRYLKAGARPGASIFHAAGAFYLQEASAMLSVAVLQPRPGERILDLCAAPGGKSTQIAAYMQNRGLLISNEPDSARCKVLASNLERMGALNACVVNAYPNALSAKWIESFDAVLCDAPCSGEGMFRREPNSRLEWRASSPAGCAKRQADILDHAAKMLKKGGRLVYSTCTFNPDENERSIAAFLARHPEFQIGEFEINGVGKSEGGAIRIFPHRHRGDGHFAALLIKSGDTKNAPAKPIKIDKESAKYMALLEETVCALPDFLKNRALIRVGDYLYALPENCPDLKNLKCALNGACLLRIGKNYIEPAHALAMGLDCACAHRRVELTTDEAVKYLAGETIEHDGEKGWTLLTHRGLPLGWGKLSNGQIKNHLPKGLRLSLHLADGESPRTSGRCPQTSICDV